MIVNGKRSLNDLCAHIIRYGDSIFCLSVSNRNTFFRRCITRRLVFLFRFNAIFFLNLRGKPFVPVDRRHQIFCDVTCIHLHCRSYTLIKFRSCSDLKDCSFRSETLGGPVYTSLLYSVSGHHVYSDAVCSEPRLRFGKILGHT
jgi:hypothetical protein